MGDTGGQKQEVKPKVKSKKADTQQALSGERLGKLGISTAGAW